MHKESSARGLSSSNPDASLSRKDGSAARNGLLTDHYICEINGRTSLDLKVEEGSRKLFQEYALNIRCQATRP